MVNELAVKQLTPTNGRREAWRSELETQRKAIYRDCPRDLVIDDDHALSRVAGVMQAGAGAPMARRYLIKGLRADGFAEADIARALRASPDELARAFGKLPLWDVGISRLNELKARTLSAPGDALEPGRSMSNAEQRQGNLLRGSRGWRTPRESRELSTTPRHA